MRRLAILILGILIGGAAVWLYLEKRPAQKPPEVVEQAKTEAHSLGEDIKAKLNSWHLNTDEIKADLEKTGTIIRQKSSEIGKKVSDATADTRITATIK